MKSETSQYAPLPVEEIEEPDESTLLGSPDRTPDEEIGLVDKSEDEWPEKSPESSSLGTFSQRALQVALILSIACSVVSIVFLVLNAYIEWRLHDLLGSIVVQSGHEIDRPDPGLLERPNVYVGLDKLPLDVLQSALPNTLDVFPPLFQPVDHIHRNYVFPDDGHARFTFNGRVAPGDHRVLLTDHITMVAQFRVHDYGMERCRVVSSIPSWDLLQSRNQTLHLAGDTSNIEVWNLTTPAAPNTELNAQKLSWASKPPREKVIATAQLAENSTLKSGEFWCGPSGSLQTLEFVCKGVGCYVELWQDIYFKPRFGIYIQQSPSI